MLCMTITIFFVSIILVHGMPVSQVMDFIDVLQTDETQGYGFDKYRIYEQPELEQLMSSFSYHKAHTARSSMIHMLYNRQLRTDWHELQALNQNKQKQPSIPKHLKSDFLKAIEQRRFNKTQSILMHRAILEKNPNFMDSFLRIGYLKCAMRKSELEINQGLLIFQSIGESSDRYPEATFLMVQEWIVAARFLKAKKILKERLPKILRKHGKTKHNDNYPCLYLLAYLLRLQGEFNKALELLQFISRITENCFYMFEMGRTLRMLKQYDKALAVFNLFKDWPVLHFDSAFEIALILRMTHEYDKAIRLYDEIITSSGDYAISSINLEMPLLLKAQGHIYKAIDWLDKNIKSQKIEIPLEAAIELADMYRQINELDMSNQILDICLGEAAKVEKTYVNEILFRMAMNYKLKNQTEIEYQVLMQIMTNDPQFFRVHIEIDEILTGQSMFDLFQTLEKHTTNQTVISSFVFNEG